MSRFVLGLVASLSAWFRPFGSARFRRVGLAVVCGLASPAGLSAQQLAFPGAEGFGRFATGGRGGEVYVVTNLNDSGAGSLRAGVTGRTTSSPPRTVVFAVSGTIYLQSTLRITQGNLTIAGQTAPGEGICLAYRPLDISNSSNVIIRFLRVRLGDVAGVETDAFTSRYSTNVIIDHCSFSWSVDETSSTYDNTDLTQQWCFITESMRDSVHSKGAHGYGGIWGGRGASYHHNLIAHHDSRNPRFNGARTHGTGDELVDMRNNVIYNWRGNSTYGGEPTDTGLPARHNMVNNVYKNGPATSTGTSRYRILEPTANSASTGAPYSLFHISGNWTTASSAVTTNNWNGGVQVIASSLLPSIRSDTAFDVPPVITQTAQNAYPLVLAYAGCRLPARDVIDTRIAAEVSSGTVTFYGSKGNLPGIIDSQADVGGWPALASLPAPSDTDADGMPDAWELARGLNPASAADRNLVDPASGYTQLELYLNELAAPAFPVPVISIQPQGANVALGGALTLSVTATGPGTLGYQWYRGATLLDGATGPSLGVTTSTVSDAGDYTVVVTNDYGSTRSATATVTLAAQPPVVTTQPASLSVDAGQTATFNVVANGSPPLTYQWYRGEQSLAGETASTLQLTAVGPAVAGAYRVVVTNPYGFATSASAALAVSTRVTTRVFSTTFESDTVHAAAPQITATSTNWYVMATKNATAATVANNLLTLRLNAATTAGNFQAAAVFTPTPLDVGAVGSSVTVTATFRPTALLNLGFGLFNSGGSLPHTYHHDGSVAGNLIAAATANPPGLNGILGGTQTWVGYHGFLNTAATSGMIFRRLAQTNPAPTDNRSQDLVTNGSTNSTYQFPAGASIGTLTNSGGAISFTTGAEYTLVYEIARGAADQYTLGYKLYSGPAATIGPATQLFSSAGATTVASALPSAVTSAFDSFAIGGRATDGTTVPAINVSRLTVDHSFQATTPVFTSQPSNQTLDVGAPLTLSAGASANPAPAYQWYKGVAPTATAIDGATSSTFTLGSVTSGDAGFYFVVASNLSGSVASEAAVVTVVSAASPYETWSSGKGLTSADNGASQDPDGDGVVNLAEFALGGDPLSAASAPVAALAREGANFAFTFDVNTAALAQFTVGAETSPDLVAWTAAVHGAGGVTIASTPLDATTDRVVVTVPDGPARLFVRLRVTKRP